MGLAVLLVNCGWCCIWVLLSSLYHRQRLLAFGDAALVQYVAWHIVLKGAFCFDVCMGMVFMFVWYMLLLH